MLERGLASEKPLVMSPSAVQDQHRAARIGPGNADHAFTDGFGGGSEHDGRTALGLDLRLEKRLENVGFRSRSMARWRAMRSGRRLAPNQGEESDGARD